MFRWLTTDEITLNAIDADDPEITDYHFMPDVGKLSECARVCLQKSEEVPRDFTSLFDLSMYKMDTSVLPDVIKYE